MQQINLFQPEFRHQADPLSLRVMAMTCLLATLLLTSSGGYGWLVLENQRGVVSSLKNHHDKLQAQLAVLSLDLGNDQSIDQHIEALKQQVNKKTSTAQQLQWLLADRNRVAQQFQALSELHIPGLWLTTILLGEENELHGVANQSQLVPEYLKQIGLMAEFNNLQFDQVELVESEAQPAAVKFILRGQPIDRPIDRPLP